VTKKIAEEIQRTWERKNKSRPYSMKGTEDIESILLNTSI